MLDDFDNEINVEDVTINDLVFAYTSCMTTSTHMISLHEDMIDLETGASVSDCIIDDTPSSSDVVKLERTNPANK